MLVPRTTFREYDIRGVADRDLSDELAASLGRAFVGMVRDGLPAGAAGEWGEAISGYGRRILTATPISDLDIAVRWRETPADLTS